MEVACIVRSVGELTTEKCCSRLGNIFGEENIILLENITPFEETLRMMIKAAVNKGAEWTLAVDADVFLDCDSILAFMKYAKSFEQNNPEVLCLMPLLYDHFFDTKRSCGVHLYKTSNLAMCGECIVPGQLRGETVMLFEMQKKGYKSFLIKKTVGIHDFGQSPADIIAKGLLQGKKFSLDKNNEIIAEIKDRKSADIMWWLMGLELSKKTCNVVNDRSVIRALIKDAGIEPTEREKLTDSEIDELLHTYVTANEE